MATNTLTNLIQPFYDNLDVVSRELTGMIPSVTLDSEANAAAINQTVYVPVAPASTAADITPAVSSPDTGAQTVGATAITISNQRAVPIQWTGEETAAVTNPNGPGYSNIRANQIQQAIRTLANEMEDDLTDLYSTFSRAFGTAGTTPFAAAGEFDDASEVLKILKDNGAPMSGNCMVVNTAAGAKLLGFQNRFDVIGDPSFNQQGIITKMAGMDIKESGQIEAHTKGTGASATTDDSGYAVGATVITLASAGTGTIVAGDVITFAGDTNKYVVVSGDGDVSGGGTITLAAPGLKVAIATSATAITVGSSYAANLGFHPSAIVLANRLPYSPPEGDEAADRMTVVDPRSGMMFELSLYKQYRRVHYEVAAAWGVKNIKPEHTALLLG